MSKYTHGEMTEDDLIAAILKRPGLYMPLVLKHVTRITVVTDEGQVFERYSAFESGVELHLQDSGRTLKVFPKSKE